MNSAWQRISLWIFTVLLLASAGVAAPSPDSLRAGFATADITPPLGTDLCGYGYYTDRKATEVRDPLLARAVVLESAGKRIAIVGTDLVAVTLQQTEEVRKEVAKVTGIPGSDIMVTATHTHSGPATITCISCGENDPKYLGTLPSKIAQAVILASAKLQPVTVSFGEGRVEGVAMNREYDGGPIDEKVRVLKFMHGSQVVGFIAHYTVHPVVLGPDSHLITGDLVEEAEDKVVRDYPGAVAVFLQGAAGDINPVVCSLPPKEGVAKLEELSGLLAGGIREALKSTSPLNVSPVAMEAREVRLPRVVPDRALVVLRLDDAERWLKRTDLPDDFRREIRFQKESALAVLDRFDHPPLTETVSEIQVARLGEMLIVGCPGELFFALGQQTASLLPGFKVLVTAYADDYIDYFPTPDRYDLTGLGTGWATTRDQQAKYSYDYAAYYDPWFLGQFHLRSDVGDVLVQAMVKLARDVGEVNKP